MPKLKLSDDDIQRIVHALADPNRYNLLERIYASKDAMTCACAKGDLTISDATCSHHLKELVTANLITMERDGRHRLLTPRRDVWKAFVAEMKSL